MVVGCHTAEDKMDASLVSRCMRNSFAEIHVYRDIRLRLFRGNTGEESHFRSLNNALEDKKTTDQMVMVEI